MKGQLRPDVFWAKEKNSDKNPIQNTTRARQPGQEIQISKLNENTVRIKLTDAKPFLPDLSGVTPDVTVKLKLAIFEASVKVKSLIEALQGLLIPFSINAQFDLKIIRDDNDLIGVELEALHQDFPSYILTVNNKKKYSFDSLTQGRDVNRAPQSLKRAAEVRDAGQSLVP